MMYVDLLVPQQATEFQSEAQKTRFLKNTMFGLEWSITPSYNIPTACYTYSQFVTALNESYQVQSDLNTFKGASTRYCQLITHPNDVRRYTPNNRSSDLQVQILMVPELADLNVTHISMVVGIT